METKEKGDINKCIRVGVRKVREALNLNEEKFAATAGLSAETITAIEQGETKANLDTIMRICNTFHVNRNYLVMGMQPMYSVSVDENDGMKEVVRWLISPSARESWSEHQIEIVATFFEMMRIDEYPCYILMDLAVRYIDDNEDRYEKTESGRLMLKE